MANKLEPPFFKHKKKPGWLERLIKKLDLH